MNAVRSYARLLPVEAVRRLAALRLVRFDVGAQELFASAVRPGSLDAEEARERVVERWEGDLCGLLNAMTRGELEWLAAMVDVKREGRALELRERLWGHGSALERCGEDVPASLQPSPVLLGGHLVVMAPPRGAFPPPGANDDGRIAWPRVVPAPRDAEPPSEEPESLDDLLAAADRAIGVRLGRRGRDKGAWGMRAARLLGVEERGGSEPDWRGDVEIKTVPVAREPSGLWRIVEDPAIAMVGEGGALAKLQRTLWLARADVDGDDAAIVCWYLLDWDHVVARLVRQYLHERPKGPKGTDQRGLYLHKRFFADCGLLAALNGPAR